MAPNYQSIVALMNIILMACAGFTIIGFYRILKVLGLVPWEASAPREMTFLREQEGLDTDLMLPNLRVADTAFISGGKTQDQAAAQRAEVC
jgi:hypothetical protein